MLFSCPACCFTNAKWKITFVILSHGRLTVSMLFLCSCPFPTLPRQSFIVRCSRNEVDAVVYERSSCNRNDHIWLVKVTDIAFPSFSCINKVRPNTFFRALDGFSNVCRQRCEWRSVCTVMSMTERTMGIVHFNANVSYSVVKFNIQTEKFCRNSISKAHSILGVVVHFIDHRFKLRIIGACQCGGWNANSKPICSSGWYLMTQFFSIFLLNLYLFHSSNFSSLRIDFAHHVSLRE